MFLIYQVHLMDNVRLKNYFVIHDIVLKKNVLLQVLFLMQMHLKLIDGL